MLHFRWRGRHHQQIRIRDYLPQVSPTKLCTQISCAHTRSLSPVSATDMTSVVSGVEFIKGGQHRKMKIRLILPCAARQTSVTVGKPLTVHSSPGYGNL